MKISVLFALPLALSVAGPAAAQSYSNNDWQSWYGCWRADNAPAGELLCIVPDGAGVRMVTLVDGAARADSRILADGQARRSQADGCSSAETARWSRDRQRVFLSSEMRCGQGVTRNVRGMLAFIGPEEWVSVQTVTTNDGTATRAVRFVPARGARIPAAIAAVLESRTFASVLSAPQIDESDVTEATSYVDAAAVQEWLRLGDAPFEIADRSQYVNGSALDQIGRMSQDVRYEREVVQIVERPVYIVRTYGRRYYSTCWTPWGYDHYGWRVTPFIHIRFPIIVHRDYRDRYYVRDRYDYRDRYDRRDRNDYHDRYGNRDRYTRDRDDNRARIDYTDRTARPPRDSNWGSSSTTRDGRVTRNGYVGRGTTTTRQPQNTTRQPQNVSRQPQRAARQPQASSRQPQRSTSGSATSRKAKARAD